MKIALLVIKIILILLLIFNLFFWAGIYGSGHKIPKETEITLSVWAISLISTLIAVAFIKRKISK